MVSAPILQAGKHRVSEVVAQEDLERHGISPEELSERIADIISRNLTSGRAERVMAASGGAGEPGGHGDTETSPPLLVSEGPPLSPSPCPRKHSGAESGHLEGYFDRVIATYLQEHTRVEALAARDEAAWTELYEQLAGRACYILRSWQVSASRATNEAADFAQQTCETIFRHPFPYDVSFDAWSTLILKNHIRWRYTRSRDLTDRDSGVMSLDQPKPRVERGDLSLHDLLADASGLSAFESWEVQAWLLGAVASLRSRAQQQVIIDTYFDGLSDDEISQRMGKTKQAIHNLRHRALRRLKSVLSHDESS